MHKYISADIFAVKMEIMSRNSYWPGARISQAPEKKAKKKFQLPWWFIYVGYGLALCTCGISFWMTVEVAGQFGAKKSKEWLFSFCISVVESIFISQPLKVCSFMYVSSTL